MLFTINIERAIVLMVMKFVRLGIHNIVVIHLTGIKVYFI